MDIYYLIFVLPAVLFALIAQQTVNSRFHKYSSVRNYRGLTGAEAVNQVLRANGVYDVTVEKTGGRLTDHYDPRNNTIRLSADVHDGVSVAAVGIAAHEAGHAIQYAQDYAPIKLRQSIIPVTRIGSMLSMPLVLLGLILYSPMGEALLLTGIMLFGAAMLFQLITLPVEFDASNRAMQTLGDSRILEERELAQTKKVLSAAAMTYVAALAVSLMQFLRLLLIFSGRRGRR